MHYPFTSIIHQCDNTLSQITVTYPVVREWFVFSSFVSPDQQLHPVCPSRSPTPLLQVSSIRLQHTTRTLSQPTCTCTRINQHNISITNSLSLPHIHSTNTAQLTRAHTQTVIHITHNTSHSLLQSSTSLNHALNY